MSAGLVFTLLLHALLLWLILSHRPDMVRTLTGDRDTETTLVMIPNSPDKQQQAQPAKGVEAPPPPPPPVARPAKPRKRATPRVAANAPPPPPPDPNAITVPQAEVAPPTLVEQKPPEPPAPAAAPPEDFSTKLAARQKQRAEAESQERERQTARGNPQQQENERGNQAALANIASALHNAGIEKESGGGLFQIQNLGTHHAEFLFRGWKKEASRNWSQMIQVDQGAEADVRIAIVKKMIAIIRQHAKEDFTWESHRLGRKMTLSARAEDSAGLEAFLMREFFPDFTPAPPGR